MKREILCRAKRTDNGEWVEGFYFDGYILNYIDLAQSWTPNTADHKVTARAFKVDPETVGQFTGCKDKKKNKIFEGDIVQVNTHNYIIEFRGIGFWFVDSDNDCWVYDPNTYPLLSIGNIHDNPELINQP